MCCTGQRCAGVGISARSGRRGLRAVGGVRSRFRRGPARQVYLVVFDGEDWADVVPMRARSVTEIATSYPEATVLEHRPVWMSVQEYDRLRCEAGGLD
jgi:hypothetical protein